MIEISELGAELGAIYYDRGGKYTITRSGRKVYVRGGGMTTWQKSMRDRQHRERMRREREARRRFQMSPPEWYIRDRRLVGPPPPPPGFFGLEGLGAPWGFRALRRAARPVQRWRNRAYWQLQQEAPWKSAQDIFRQWRQSRNWIEGLGAMPFPGFRQAMRPAQRWRNRPFWQLDQEAPWRSARAKWREWRQREVRAL